MISADRHPRTEAVCAGWSTALAVTLGSSLPVCATELKFDRTEGIFADAPLIRSDVFRGRPQGIEDGTNHIQLAQFQMPQGSPGGGPPPSSDGVTSRHRLPGALPWELPQRLSYQYSFGSESEIAYVRDADLNKRVRDNSLLLKPQLNGLIIYRPTDWMITTLEMVLDKEFTAHKESSFTLPNGETSVPPNRYTSLLVDQAFVTIRGITAPFEFSVGRRNYEDERHWLYDTSMDTAGVTLRQGTFRLEAFGGREIRTDLAVIGREVRDRIDTYVVYAEERGIEDTKVAAYTIVRRDRDRLEGQPRLMGARIYGVPSEELSYWTELAYLRGSDELSRPFFGRAFDVGFTYRYLDLPLSPNLTLGYAFGSGDGVANDKKNTEFRQTGLQSNETRLAGFSKLRAYGEALDPELSNLKIFTLGLGFRPAPTASVDLVYHRYRLDKLADETRNSGLTAQMNQDDTQLSRDMGSELDVVLGFRNLFGVQRLGLDLRAGWFFPGKAYRLEEGDPNNPTFRRNDRGLSVVAKIWY
jgi:alginate production protein